MRGEVWRLILVKILNLLFKLYSDGSHNQSISHWAVSHNNPLFIIIFQKAMEILQELFKIFEIYSLAIHLFVTCY